MLRVAIALAAVGLLALGAYPRFVRSRTLDLAEVAKSQPRKVNVADAKPGSDRAEVSLPGNVLALKSAVIFARTSGFLRKYHVDIGDKVKAGQLMAEIEATEVTEQLGLARARLEESEKNAELAKTQADRLEGLANEGAVSVSQAEAARASANSASAALKSSRAEVTRQGAFTGYARVVAPFDGVVTKRTVDVGALVTAGSNAGTSPLFELQQLDALKVFIEVPQAYALGLTPGIAASVSPSDAPGVEVKGVVARTSGALDSATRTLRVEIHLPAGQGLLAGAFVRVKMLVPRLQAPVVIPAAALVVRKDGTQVVAMVDGRAHYISVSVGRDLGRDIEIVRGLSGTEKLVLAPSDDISEGEPLRN